MPDLNNEIHIIATGGTIDSKFYAPTESSKVKEKSGIADFLEKIISPHFTYKFEQLVMLDSSDITDEIRLELMNKIKNSQSDKILITHGTNTMCETLSFLNKQLINTDKTVILTGAMIPMDGFCPTDGGFNLGYAISKLQSIGSGIYISMNGQVFSSDEVYKNFDIARFEFKDQT